jgi:uncharacterized protein YndB with AHSA1/START domain
MNTEASFGAARAVADLSNGSILATVEIAASPERVFQALASREIIDWWVRPGVFDTREWTADVRVGGRWRASGIGRGRPYSLEGEFVEIDPPRKLVHTWHPVGSPDPPSVVSYVLEPAGSGTRLTLRHTGMTSRDASAANAMGWETSLARLAEKLTHADTSAG